jgi:serine/threonine protein kinase
MDPQLRSTLPAVDRLGMPLVTSGQFAFVYKLKSTNDNTDYAVRCFRGYLGDRDQRYRAIQRHLGEHPVSLLSDFAYAPEGILVNGQRYPTLAMHWLEGPTLDLYLDEMIKRREVLFHLGQEWLKLIEALREAEIAHGDLQHGNILVQNGMLRLVDHDGLYVPEMRGWQASELGHQHYQHPLRTARHFDATLDNFSALVIYLTLISLAERPALWKEYHDENLLFTKADFVDPSASSLFAKIKEIDGEPRRLAEVLEQATRSGPESAPYLLDLVKAESTLPAWMSGINLQASIKTREQVSPQLTRQQPRWSHTAEQPFPAVAGPSLPPPVQVITDPNAVWTNTIKFSRQFLSKIFIWWYFGIYFLLKVVGVDFSISILLTVIAILGSSLVTGLVRAQKAKQKALKAAKLAASLPPLAQVSSLSIPGSLTHVPTSVTANDPLIGNAALSIFHRDDCEWVKRIQNKNRVTFASPYEAKREGYKACQVCSPAN